MTAGVNARIASSDNVVPVIGQEVSQQGVGRARDVGRIPFQALTVDLGVVSQVSHDNQIIHL